MQKTGRLTTSGFHRSHYILQKKDRSGYVCGTCGIDLVLGDKNPPCHWQYAVLPTGFKLVAVNAVPVQVFN